MDNIRHELGIDPKDNQGVVAQKAKERCRQFLRSGTSFAFNATNTTRLTRGRWIDLFADYNAQIEIVYLEPVFSQVLNQNKSRNSAVPESVIKKLADKCEPPNQTECHKLIYWAKKEHPIS